jgi:hypothetical protein
MVVAVNNLDTAATNTAVDSVDTVTVSTVTVSTVTVSTVTVSTVTVSTVVLALHRKYHMHLFQNYYNNSFMLYQYRQQWQN